MGMDYEDDEVADELGARIDALRLVVCMLIRSMPDRPRLLTMLMRAEEQARMSNLHSATIEEIAAMRDIMDDE